MKLLSFSIIAAPTGPVARAVENVPSPVAHAVGAGSGLTGVALYAEWAGHLTTFGGLIAMGLSILGAVFYVAYRALIFWREWKNPPAPRKRRSRPSSEE